MLFKPPTPPDQTALGVTREELFKQKGIPAFVLRIGSMRSPGLSHSRCVELQTHYGTLGKSSEIIFDPQGF